MLQAYTVFHLNLAFSSIEEAQRPTVIQRCYWPLLDLVRRGGFRLGIEAPGYTLEAVAAIDPAWISELRALVREERAEFVGSGYAQLIGPLVPPAVLEANLRFGREVYERLLGATPRIALVNEQAWSASLVPHYLSAGYRGIVMEWDNPYAAHPEWRSTYRYHPQCVEGPDGSTIPVLWNHSIAFQKFQRFAHGELELDEYVSHLLSHDHHAGTRLFPLYGSDAEVFDFRPGRYRTEAPLAATDEWRRIETLLSRLAEEPTCELITPSAALDLRESPDAGHVLSLASPQKPVPVKKQPKYDLARWAISGRDDLGINTACWRAYEALRRQEDRRDADWRELCYLWSSDFRTHITPSRWRSYLERLTTFTAHVGATPRESEGNHPSTALSLPSHVHAQRQGRYLTIRTDVVEARLNCRRGLAIDALVFPKVSSHSLCGSVAHGYFDDIEWSADQYTGFLVFAAPGQPQVTDLEPVDPTVAWDAASHDVVVCAQVATPLGVIEKRLRIGAEAPRLSVTYRLRWPDVPLGTLRLGHVTLNPLSFDRASLYYATHNGGPVLECFALASTDFDHVAPVSHLVSCRGGVGATGGVVVMGDAKKAVRVEIDAQSAALFPLVTMRTIGDRYLARVTLSARELDDTSRLEGTGRSPFVDEIRWAVAAA